MKGTIHHWYLLVWFKFSFSKVTMFNQCGVLKSLSVAMQMKAAEQKYFPGVLFIMLCEMVLTIKGAQS